MMRFLLFISMPLILCARDWTALVYMAADNDLAQWADSDLVEMELVGSSDEVTIVVQVDRPYIGAERLFIGDGTSYQLQDLGIIDMCDWQTLYNFLAWGMSYFPADKYLVILWDHGSGWTYKPRQAFGNDWSSGNELGIYTGDFQKALSTAHDYTGEKIDILGFDACLMQQIEVAFEVIDYVDIIAAPQSLCPIQGYPYDIILAKLIADPGMNARDYTQTMVYDIAGSINDQPFAFSAIELKYLTTLKDYFDEFAQEQMHNTVNPAFIQVRDSVQTLPIIDRPPNPDDEFVDLGDLITGWDEIFSNANTEQLVQVYNNMVVATAFTNDYYNKTTGLTIWFPGEYRLFKQLIDEYIGLNWAQSQWRQFLNWYYGLDDIRPTQVTIAAPDKIGDNNNFWLKWNESYDLAKVTYNIIEAEASNITLVFTDLCEDSSQWDFAGFSIDSSNVYAGNYSFFSGNQSNLQNWIQTKQNLSLNQNGILDLYLYYNTEDMTDSLVIEYNSVRDVHYGWSNGWLQRRILLPPGNDQLKISYYTNGSTNQGGCYIDDISISQLRESRYIRQDYPDTTLHIFDKLKGNYIYAVQAEDAYENTSNLSDFIDVSITQYAAPYSVPGPFQTSCNIILDYPDTLFPSVEIFSLFGRKVKTFDIDDIDNNKVHWDGKDDQGEEIGSGIYFVLVKDKAFKRIGKIARQR